MNFEVWIHVSFYLHRGSNAEVGRKTAEDFSGRHSWDDSAGSELGDSLWELSQLPLYWQCAGRRADHVLSAFANDIESCEGVAKLKKPCWGCIAPSIVVKVFRGRLARKTWCLISMGRGIEYMWVLCTQYIQRVTDQEIKRKTESYCGHACIVLFRLKLHICVHE